MIPKARSLPPLDWAIALAVSTKVNSNWPPMTSFTAKGMPLYGTGIESSLPSLFSTAMLICELEEPYPAFIFPGRWRAWLRNSCTLFAGWSDRTISTNPPHRWRLRE